MSHSKGSGIQVAKYAETLILLDQIFTSLLTANVDAAEIPIFVSIDTEQSSDKLCELGISKFDPYSLLVPGNDSPDCLNDQIVTHCYTSSANKRRFRYKPYRLGIAEKLCLDELEQLLNMHLSPENVDGSPRKVVLVGHSVGCDLWFLRHQYGIDLSRAPSVIAIVDTVNLSWPVLQTERCWSLRRILQALELEYIGLHNAAHDSRYTLRAMLMLFVQFKRMGEVDLGEGWEKMFELVERVARCHRTNPKRTWCVSTRVKVVPGPSIFDLDLDGEDDSGGFSTIPELLM